MFTPETTGTISESMTAQIAGGCPACHSAHMRLFRPHLLCGACNEQNARARCKSICVPGHYTLSTITSMWGSPYLRILVEKLHVRVSRRAINIEVVLLHIFAVVAFAVC